MKSFKTVVPSHRAFIGIAVAILVFADQSYALGLGDLPLCAQAPLLGIIKSSYCQLTDWNCICGNTELIQNIQAAVSAVCNAEEQQKTLQVAGEICPNLVGYGSSDVVPSDPPPPPPEPTSSSPLQYESLPPTGTDQASYTPSVSVGDASSVPGMTTTLAGCPTSVRPTGSTYNATNSSTLMPPYEGGATGLLFGGSARMVLTILSMIAMGIIFSEL